MSRDLHNKFLWGAATSSHQVEGNNKDSDWWAWEAKGNIEGGITSGLATDHQNKFKEDLQHAKNLGLNSYRFSVEWAKIEPIEGKWDANAIAWYLSLIAECEKLKLLPMVTLLHFTLPKWFANQGGLTSPQAAEKFANFVTKVAHAFEGRVPIWCTINEPIVHIVGSYLGGFMPPALYSTKNVSLSYENLLRCHLKAFEILHSLAHIRKGPWAEEKIMVGYAHNMLSFKPEKFFHPIEQLLANRLNKIYNYAWIDATTGRKQKFGLWGVIPKAKVIPELFHKNKTDFIGINYYTKAYVQWRPRSQLSTPIKNLPIGINFARRHEVSSDLGWAIYPAGLKSLLRRVSRYNLPIYITENGIADKSDSLREEYIFSHLEVIASEIERGVDVRGYYHWSLIDNFEWIKGFWPRFGLLSVDYSNFDRHIRKSGQLFSKIIKAHLMQKPKKEILATLFNLRNKS